MLLDMRQLGSAQMQAPTAAPLASSLTKLALRSVCLLPKGLYEQVS